MKPHEHICNDVDDELVEEIMDIAYSTECFGEAVMTVVTALANMMADRATYEEVSQKHLEDFSRDAVHNLNVLTLSRYGRAGCANDIPA